MAYNRSSRRSVLKCLGAGIAASGAFTARAGGSSGSQSADTTVDSDLGSVEDFTVQTQDVDHVYDTSNGDGVYELDLKFVLERVAEIPQLLPGRPDDFLTVYWDNNIWGFQSAEVVGAELELLEEYDTPAWMPTYELDGSSTVDASTENEVKSADAGWTASFSTGQPRAYEPDECDTYDVSCRFKEQGEPDVIYGGPERIEYDVTIRLLHQDDSAGRIFWELAHVVQAENDSLDNVSVCAGHGPASVCYDFGSDTKDYRVKSRTGIQAPEQGRGSSGESDDGSDGGSGGWSGGWSGSWSGSAN